MSIYSSNANLTSGDWHHISFTYNRFTSNVNLFVNNQLVGSADDVYIDLTKSTENLLIGKDNYDGNRYFTGAVDDIKIYNRELNTNELAYLSDSNNTDLFLKNQLVGHWTFEQFNEIVDSFIDLSTFENTAVSSANIVRGSQPLKGNTSVAFDGSYTISASNQGINTNYMSIGAWVKPTEYNTTFVEKEGVFSLRIKSDGMPDLKIGDTSTDGLSFNKTITNSEVNNSLKHHLTFEQNTNDSVGYAQAVGKNITYQNTSYNTDIGGSSVVLNDTSSYIDTGKMLKHVSDPNQITLGMWVNLQELEEGKMYPLTSVNNGFEWWINKSGDNAQLNFYQPGYTEFQVVFSVTDGIGNAELKITTDTQKSYNAALFADQMDTNDINDLSKINQVNTEVSGVIAANAGVEQTITFTVDKVYDKATMESYPINTVNNAYLYVSVSGGLLNESKVVEDNSLKAVIVDTELVEYQSLVMALDMSSVAGDQVSDTSTLDNHATVVNNTNRGLTTGEDADGKYIEFDGTTTNTDNTYILLDHTLLRNTLTGDNNPFTFDIVFKVKEGYVMSNANSDNDYIYICQGGETGKIYLDYNGVLTFGSGVTTNNYTLVGGVPIGSVVRHTWVYDGSVLTIYINNISVHTVTADFYGATEFTLNGTPESNAHHPASGRIPMKLYGTNIFQFALTTEQLAVLWSSNTLVGATPDPIPHLTVAPYYSNVYENNRVRTTLFSSKADIDTVYRTAVFNADVDLSNEAVVKDFVETNSTIHTGFSVAKNSIGVLDEEVTHAYTGLSNLLEPLVEGGNYQVIMVAKDTEGNVGVKKFDGTGQLATFATLST